MKELKDGDYTWGTWLAFLRPHNDLVPALLAALKDRPDARPETMLALGNSGDPRALDPLLALLKSKDYRTAGDAAQALGYLGDPKAEPALIEALAGKGWPQLQASQALAIVGSPKALPGLEKLANGGSAGALNIAGAARDAIVRIEPAPAARPDPVAGRPVADTHGRPARAHRPRLGRGVQPGRQGPGVRRGRPGRALWDPATGKALAAFPGPGRQTTEVAFAGPGVVATAGWGDDGTIHLIDTRAGRENAVIPVNKGGVDSMAVSPDGKRIAAPKSVPGEDGSVLVFDVGTGKADATLPRALGAVVQSGREDAGHGRRNGARRTCGSGTWRRGR